MQRNYKGRVKNLSSINITDSNNNWNYYNRELNRLSNSKAELRIYDERNSIIIDGNQTNIDGIKVNILLVDELLNNNLIYFLSDKNDVYLDKNISIVTKKINLNNQTLCIYNDEKNMEYINTNKDGYIGEVIHLLYKNSLVGIYFSFWLNYNSSCNIDSIINYFLKNFNFEIQDNNQEINKFF